MNLQCMSKLPGMRNSQKFIQKFCKIYNRYRNDDNKIIKTNFVISANVVLKYQKQEPVTRG